MSLREAILTALATRLASLPEVRTARNDPLPVRIPPGGVLILRDGIPGEPEVTLSPLTYHYEHRAEIDVLVQGPNGRDAAFATLTAALGGVLAADRTLGGLCDWIESRAPEPVDLLPEAGDPIKAAVVPVLIFYCTPDPL